jgi:hypothetical protein
MPPPIVERVWRMGSGCAVPRLADRIGSLALCISFHNLLADFLPIALVGKVAKPHPRKKPPLLIICHFHGFHFTLIPIEKLKLPFHYKFKLAARKMLRGLAFLI